MDKILEMLVRRANAGGCLLVDLAVVRGREEPEGPADERTLVGLPPVPTEEED